MFSVGFWRPRALRTCILSQRSLPFWSFVLEELGFFLNFPASLPHFNSLERSQPFKRIKILKKELMFHLETILLHHVQIEAIPVVQMGFGYFSLGIALQLCKEAFCLVTGSNSR